MLLLLAQLVAPPLQGGPARLPEPAPRQHSVPHTPGENGNDGLELAPESTSSTQPKPPEARPRRSTSTHSPLPRISGDLPYSSTQLETLLQGCVNTSNFESGLKHCAELLTGQLQQDGYVNSRVYTETVPAPGQLTVVMGRLVELHVESDEPRLFSRCANTSRISWRILHLPLPGAGN